ncbi:hypothetical protein ABZZ17_30080 [Streptomyces sp. NPDC006512]|uniref:hypothetical protein n=1 Tax=Streptomyces sp. NPDC006512 TaxID=3154307 RepID=UPI0033AFD781
MIVLLVLATLLLAGALYVARGFYVIRKARKLTEKIEGLEAAGAELRARTEGLKAEAKADEAERVVALGFVPEDRLDTDHPAPVPAERTAALAAVRAGDWEAGAAHLEAAGTDWEERWHRVRALAEAAVEDDAWLLAWRAARPQDPSAATVHADNAVLVAWEVRGSAWARHTSAEQFDVFHDLLRGAQKAVHAAQELADPADPVPYMVEQAVALGLMYPHERYERLWTEIVSRDPKGLSAHTNAMQYWARKWRGSHERSLAFARDAAAAAAPGDLLSLLPLIAYVEQETYEDDLKAEDFYPRPEIRTAVDEALADLAAADPADPRAVQLRHVLAYLLFWQDRDAEAVEQFRHVDGHIGAMPWYYAGNPKERYLYARNWAVRVTELED